MKNRIASFMNHDMDAKELIADFGEAKLVRIDGRIVLEGGTMADRMEALEWISMFLPEEVAQVRR